MELPQRGRRSFVHKRQLALFPVGCLTQDALHAQLKIATKVRAFPLHLDPHDHMTKRYIFLSLILSFVSVTIARADTQTEERISDRLKRAQERTPGTSLVFMHARLIEESSRVPMCQDIWVTVVSDKGESNTFEVEKTPRLFGRILSGASYGAVAVLAPGTYTLQKVGCTQPSAGIELKGDFARFRIGSNEIVNIGSFFIDYNFVPTPLFGRRTFNARTKVEPLNNEAKTNLAERLHVTFPKAITRYMTPNPATSGNNAAPSTGQPAKSAAPAPKRGD